MTVLVAYASRHGSTGQIAERIAARLVEHGVEAEARSLDGSIDPGRYGAVVLGSAVYFGRWMIEAIEFVHDQADSLAGRPVWLFSSGPLGAERTDDQGRDLREVSRPEDAGELDELLHPLEHRVFFGSLDRGGLGVGEWVVSAIPAGGDVLAEGDFRDWAEVDAWAGSIARAITGSTTGPP